MTIMHDDDPQSPALPEVKVASVETDAAPPLAANLLAVEGTATPAVVNPEMLAKGLRYLRHRIPDFTHLSVPEQRSMARAAFLDPEFIDRGIYAAGVWHITEPVTGRTGDQLRQESEETARWDEVERELLALAKGIAHANLPRKHRLGAAILDIYAVLSRYLDRVPADPDHAYMRPYYDDMKRAYLRFTRKKARKTAKAKKTETPEE